MTGSCWDDGPDRCTGCSYCEGARHTPPGELVEYPDEQTTRDRDLAQQRLNVEAEMLLRRRRRHIPLHDDYIPSEVPGLEYPY